MSENLINITQSYHQQIQSLAEKEDGFQPKNVLACLIQRDRIAHLW